MFVLEFGPFGNFQKVAESTKTNDKHQLKLQIQKSKIENPPPYGGGFFKETAWELISSPRIPKRNSRRPPLRQALCMRPPPSDMLTMLRCEQSAMRSAQNASRS